MRVLIACEYSGVVREAFRNKGHDAWSCDILDTDIPGQHYKGDVLDVIERYHFDLMVAFPPCTHLAISGSRWFKDKVDEQKKAIEFFMELVQAPIHKIAIENPVGIMSSWYQKPDQYVHPYYFGDPVQKKTGLWLKNLPLLVPTNIVPTETITMSNGNRMDAWTYHTRNRSKKIRAKLMSKTFPGLANAMADAWS